MQDARSRKSPDHPMPPLRPRADFGVFSPPARLNRKGDLRVFLLARAAQPVHPIHSGTGSDLPLSLTLAFALTVEACMTHGRCDASNRTLMHKGSCPF